MPPTRWSLSSFLRQRITTMLMLIQSKSDFHGTVPQPNPFISCLLVKTNRVPFFYEKVRLQHEALCFGRILSLKILVAGCSQVSSALENFVLDLVLDLVHHHVDVGVAGGSTSYFFSLRMFSFFLECYSTYIVPLFKAGVFVQ